MMPFAGIDIGSTMTKVVITDEQEKILASHIGPTGAEHRHLALRVMDETIKKAGLSFDALDFVVATGYGRINVPFADRQITEITCHARGIRSLFPSARIIIDIGGQDSKGIKLDADGKVANFVMNDKCAAGTGRFLEFTLHSLGISFEQLPKLADAEPYPLNTTCAVFAQSEVVSLLSGEVPLPAIVAGLFWQMATKAKNLASRLRLAFPLVFTGGMARLSQAGNALSRSFQEEILIPDEPQLTAALGAALLAKEQI
jgi:predicted CoA-substrate-specific enzyme activase